MRQSAIDYQKKVIEQEKELIEIIEGTEKKLKAERERIDNEIAIEKRKKILPERQAELARNFIVADDEFVLSLSSDEFNDFVLKKRQEMILEKEKAIEEEQKRLQKQKEEQELAQQREKERIEREKAIKEAEEKAKIETEQRLKREQEERIIAEKEKVEQENKRLA